ncbi:MerR family transcriptional regulator [Alphaproteobacteria bacterium]|jgi:DNA-binding transcriptional MerR regulator|nr:MerR family transcriptional regulator [Alphaproteobacteria bacterium]
MAISHRRKSAVAFRTISEASDELDVPQHVLRFWETKFTQIRPLKRGGRRRYYRPEDLELLKTIRDLLYVQGYTIKGVQRLFKEGQVEEALQVNDAAVGSAEAVVLTEVVEIPTPTLLPPDAGLGATLSELKSIQSDLRQAFVL